MGDGGRAGEAVASRRSRARAVDVGVRQRASRRRGIARRDATRRARGARARHRATRARGRRRGRAAGAEMRRRRSTRSSRVVFVRVRRRRRPRGVAALARRHRAVHRRAIVDDASSTDRRTRARRQGISTRLFQIERRRGRRRVRTRAVPLRARVRARRPFSSLTRVSRAIRRHVNSGCETSSDWPIADSHCAHARLILVEGLQALVEELSRS